MGQSDAGMKRKRNPHWTRGCGFGSGSRGFWLVQGQAVALAFFVDQLADGLERGQLLAQARHVSPELFDRRVRTPRRQRYVLRGEELVRIREKKRQELPLALGQGDGQISALHGSVRRVK